MMPGKPRQRACARLRAAARPAGSTRRRAAAAWSSTLREKNDGRFWPAMLRVLPARAVLDRHLEDDVAVVGHARRHLDDDADGAVAERRQRAACRRRRPASGVKVVLGTGTSSPRFSDSFWPSAPRRFGLASTLVCESLSRNRTTADGHRQVEVGGADALRNGVEVERAAAVGRPGAASGEKPAPPNSCRGRDRSCLARSRLTSRICTSTITSARGLSLASMMRSTICTTGAGGADGDGVGGLVRRRSAAGSPCRPRAPCRSAACDSSVASACDTKNVRITCSSYCVRFCVLSAATMIVRSFRTGRTAGWRS